MKRQTQAIGVRDWYGMDFLSLQEEPLKVLDNFFTQYGSFIVSGCEITANGSNYDISPGLVALEGTDPDGNPIRVVAPFAGMTNTVLPVYITLECETQYDLYHDGKVKPIVNIYKAVGSTVRTQAKIPVILRVGLRNRFIDKLQDSDHHFVTNSQITAWNAKASNTLATASQSGLMSAEDKTKLDQCATACSISPQNIYTPTSLNYSVPLSRLLFYDSADGIWKTELVDASGLTRVGFNGEVPLASVKPASIYVNILKDAGTSLQVGFTNFLISKTVTIGGNYTRVFLHFVRNGNSYYGININAF